MSANTSQSFAKSKYVDEYLPLVKFEPATCNGFREVGFYHGKLSRTLDSSVRSLSMFLGVICHPKALFPSIYAITSSALHFFVLSFSSSFLNDPSAPFGVRFLLLLYFTWLF